MKLKYLALFGIMFLFLFFLLLFFGIMIAGDEDYRNETDYSAYYGGENLSAEVLELLPLVEQYAKEFDIEQYINYLLAIIQVESGGLLPDAMQSSESAGLPPNTLDTEASIKQGCKQFAALLASAESKGCDIHTVVQAYNYGSGYISYISTNRKNHTYALAVSYAKTKSGNVRVAYTNPIAVAKNGGWRYKYGNMFYVEIINQHLPTASFDDETVQAVMMEALKYQGWRYVYGGSNPNTSFDCSGLTQWCFSKAGITLPRTAQEQYDVTQHLPLSQAQPGDLVFFHSTYNSGNYVSHVGIYVGNNKMYHAGNPIGYANLDTSYWQSHLIGVGRIRQ